MAILRNRVQQLRVVALHIFSWFCFPSIQNAAMETIFCFLVLIIMDSYLQQQTQKCLKTLMVPLSRTNLSLSIISCYQAIDPNSDRDTCLCYPVKEISIRQSDFLPRGSHFWAKFVHNTCEATTYCLLEKSCKKSRKISL